MSYQGAPPPNSGYGPASNLHMPYPSLQYGQAASSPQHSQQQQQQHHHQYQQHHALSQQSRSLQPGMGYALSPQPQQPQQQMGYSNHNAFYQNQQNNYISPVDYSMSNGFYQQQQQHTPQMPPMQLQQQPQPQQYPSYIRQDQYHHSPIQSMSFPSMQQQSHSPLSTHPSPMSHHQSPLQPQHSNLPHQPSPLQPHRSSMSHHASPLQPQHSPLPHQNSLQAHHSPPSHHQSPRQTQHSSLPHAPSPLQGGRPNIPHQPSPLHVHSSLPHQQSSIQASPMQVHHSPLPQFQAPPTPQYHIKPSPTMSTSSYEGKPPMKKVKRMSTSVTPTTSTPPLSHAPPPASTQRAPDIIKPETMSFKRDPEPLPPVKPLETIRPSDIYMQTDTIKPADTIRPSDTYNHDTIKPSDTYNSGTIKPSDVYSADTIKPSDTYNSGTIKPSDLYNSGTMRPSDMFTSGIIRPSDTYNTGTIKPSDIYNAIKPADTLKPSDIYNSVKPADTIKPSDIYNLIKPEDTIRPSDTYTEKTTASTTTDAATTTKADATPTKSPTIRPGDAAKPKSTVKAGNAIKPGDTIRPGDAIRPGDMVRPSPTTKSAEKTKASGTSRPSDAIRPGDTVKSRAIRPGDTVESVNGSKSQSPAARASTSIRPGDTIKPSDVFQQSGTIKPSDIFSVPQDTVNPSDIFGKQTFKPTDLLRPSDTIRPGDIFKAPEHVKPSDLFKAAPDGKVSDTAQSSDLVRPVSVAKTLEGDQHLLLLVLAEEYLNAAHKVGSAIALSMQPDAVAKYHKLLATGLACLEATLTNARLSPRIEAAVRLRYAGILCDETENVMEAETALTKGVILCERHRFLDLKHSMSFLLAQLNFRKSPKAAFKALDNNIQDAEAYQHVAWIYAFRFLRATLSVESKNFSDMHSAVQNLRQICHLANTRGDKAISLMASLMEVLVHLGSGAQDAIEQAQRALASALRHQFEAESKIPQLTCLTHMLDLVCSLMKGEHHLTVSKVKQLQQLMDQYMKDKSWGASNIVSIPITRTKGQTQIVGEGIQGILSVDSEGREFLNIAFMSRNDAYALIHLLSGVVYIHKDPGNDANGHTCLRNGLNALSGDVARSRSTADFLPVAMQKLEWRGMLICYFHIYLAFCSAATTQWNSLKQHLTELEKTAKTFGIDMEGPVGYFHTYLLGIYHQGRGDFDKALGFFRDTKFELSDTYSPGVDFTHQFYRDMSILATLNALCIAQDHSLVDHDYNTALMTQLEPLCTKHNIKEISTAFNLIKAIITTNPPAPMFEIKNCLKTALATARAAQNNLFSCIALSVMYSAFFKNVVGDQAEKSAKAAVAQARMSGNLLWMSVADGLLSQCLDVQGKKGESQAMLKQALQLAQQAVPGF